MPRGSGVDRPAAGAVAAECFDRLEIAFDSEETLRFLGYPKGAGPRADVRGELTRAFEEARGLVRPRGAFALYEVAAQDRRTLTLEGGVTFHGAIGEFLAASARVAVFVASAGPEIVRRAREAWTAGDLLGGWIWDALGSQAAEGAADALTARLRPRLREGEELTLRYSPGYCGMDLAEQRLIFDRVDAGAIGVSLLPTLLMEPVKSVSGLIGVAPRERVEAYRSPCDRCAKDGCHMRR